MNTRKDVHPALKEPRKFIQIRDVPPDLHRAIKVKAVEMGTTMEALIISTLVKVFVK